jgi:hypothetical protein
MKCLSQWICSRVGWSWVVVFFVWTVVIHLVEVNIKVGRRSEPTENICARFGLSSSSEAIGEALIEIWLLYTCVLQHNITSCNSRIAQALLTYLSFSNLIRHLLKVRLKKFTYKIRLIKQSFGLFPVLPIKVDVSQAQEAFELHLTCL